MKIADNILQKAKKIKLLCLDVDGVLTDGKLFFTGDKTELKAFNSLDGQGLKLIRQTDIEVAIITARQSDVVDRRMEELGIEHVFQNQKNKLTTVKTMADKLNLSLEQVAYVGDDLPDLAPIMSVGLGVAVINAAPTIKIYADWQTSLPGGHGAVREVCNLLLQAQDQFEKLIATYMA